MAKKQNKKDTGRTVIVVLLSLNLLLSIVSPFLLKEIVKQEILANEYEKMGSQENFEVINKMNLPQIEVAVTKYKQENQPKMVSQAEIKSILDEGYNQGNNDAEFIWLEYSELECPYCGTFANSNATDMVKQAYGDKVVHGFRHFPLSFHQKAIPAAIVAECAGEQKGSEAFYGVIAKSFKAGQQDLESMIGFAKEVGVDEEQIRTCIVSETYKNKINAQMRTGSQKFGITGTPGHVLINTKTGEYKNVSGAVSGDKLINAIESIK